MTRLPRDKAGAGDLTDFPRATARVSEGFCPFHNHELEVLDAGSKRLALAASHIFGPRAQAFMNQIVNYGFCMPCGNAFRVVDVSEAGEDPRIALFTARGLVTDEIHTLYKREDDETQAAIDDAHGRNDEMVERFNRAFEDGQRDAPGARS